MPSTTTAPITTQPATARPHGRSIARRAVKRETYTVDSQPRVLFTVYTHGASMLIDTPAEFYETAASGLPTPDTFIVEPRLDEVNLQELDAIVADYLEQAAVHARVPMTFSRIGALLGALAE